MTADHTDAIGNDAVQAIESVIKDTLIPTVTINTLTTINDSNVNSYDLSGTCSEDSRTVTVAAGGLTETPTCSSSAWSISNWDISSVSDDTSLGFTADHTDAAGNSASQASASVLKDTTAPSAPGSATNSAWITSTSSSPLLSWSSSAQAASYEVALGTSPGSDDITNWTDIGLSLSYTFSNLSLTECTPYYMSVRAIDSAGNTSSVTQSNTPFQSDVTPPTLSAVTMTTAGGLTYARTASWEESSDNCQIDSYAIAIGTSQGGTEVHNFINIGNVTTYVSQDGVNGAFLDLKFVQKYYTTVQGTDLAGNSSTMISEAWDFFNPKDITGIFMWFDASDLSTLWNDKQCNQTPVTENDDIVQCWKDKVSGHQLENKSQYIAGPTYYNQKLKFLGSDLWSYHTSINVTDFNLLIVMDEETRTDQYLRWRHSDGYLQFRIAHVDNGVIYFDNVLDAGGRVRMTYNPEASPTLPESLFHFQNSNNVKAIRQDTFLKNSNTAVLSLNNVDDLRVIEGFYGTVSELIIITSHVSDEVREKLEGYMMCKAGLGSSIPAGHVYKNSCQ